jgi:hypothetical protein
MNSDQRIEALRDLIELREPISVATGRLRSFPWDIDSALVTLTMNDLIGVIEGYLRRELSETEVEEWAEAIDGRDDIGYESYAGGTLKQIIFELANPLLATSIDHTQALRWKEVITGPD